MNNNTHNPILQFVDQILNKSISDVVKKDFVQSKPAVNIIELSDKYLVQLAAPGLMKTDFDISLDNDKLTISKSIDNPSDTDNDVSNLELNTTRKEYDFSQFKRSFILPQKADKSSIKASYKLGILEISIAKKDKSEIKKQHIEIK